jgi:hypothetical protein
MKRSLLLLALALVTGTPELAGKPLLSAAELRGRNGARSHHRVVSQLSEDTGVPEAAAESPEVDQGPAAEPIPAPRSNQARPKSSGSKRLPAPIPAHQSEQFAWEDDGEFMPHHGDHPVLDDLCTDGSCSPRHAHPSRHWWGSAEYLLWWRAERDTPTLVTTATTSVDEDTDGQLGQANTRVLLGSESFDARILPGGRFDIGFWTDSCDTLGFGGRFTALGDDDVNYRIDQTQVASGVLTIPFFNRDAAVNEEDTLLVAHPDTGATGNINVLGHNEVYALDLYMRRLLLRECDYRLDLIGGYFFSRINEDLVIDSTTLVGNTVNIRDEFRTKNEYHGGSVGLLGEWNRDCWQVNMLAKIAFTNVTQTVLIDGQQNVDNGAQVTPNGLFTQASNIGTQERDDFSVVPEFGIQSVYHLGCGVDLISGYSLIYWDNVLRPGDQIDRVVDNTQTIARPAANFVESDYWAHGMNFGLRWTY